MFQRSVAGEFACAAMRDDLVLGPGAAGEVEGVHELEVGGLGGGVGLHDAVDFVVGEGDVEG